MKLNSDADAFKLKVLDIYESRRERHIPLVPPPFKDNDVSSRESSLNFSKLSVSGSNANVTSLNNSNPYMNLTNPVT